MKKNLLSLHFPLGGVDRSTAIQNQPPYTTSKAQNVWPHDANEGRERGGSRPGLGPFIRDPLGNGPVRMLAKVGIVQEPTNDTVQSLQVNQFKVSGVGLSSNWVQPVFSTTSLVTGDSGLKPSNTALYGAAINYFDDGRQSAGSSYEYGARIVPNGGTTAGTYKIIFNVAGTPLSGKEFALTLDGAGGYSGNVDGHTFSGNDGHVGGGWMFLQLVKSGGNYLATGYWRTNAFGPFNIGSLSYFNWGLGIQWASASSGGSIAETSTQFPSSWRKSTRQEILVAISDGDLYYQTAPRSMTKLSTSYKFAKDRRIEAVEYEQKLYIADYSWLLKGSDGALAATAFTSFSTGSGENFTTRGVTTSYNLSIQDSTYTQNEFQTVALAHADGGTFTLTFNGETTSALAWNASASTVKTALEALSGIDTVNVTTGGSAPYTYTIEFTGALAATNVSQLTADISLLTFTGAPPSPSVTITTTHDGANGDDAIGVYPIASVSGTTLSLTAAPPHGAATSLGTLTYMILKSTMVFDPVAGTLSLFKATSGKGIAPIGCRLIAKYLDRLVLAAPPDTPHLWFMSRKGDPYDWDYSLLDSGAPVSASLSNAGDIGDPITALIPHTDECMIFGCYSSLWVLKGDVATGGRIDNLSRRIGVVDSGAWCALPDDQVVFLSQDGLYIIGRGCSGTPVSLSRERLPIELQNLSSAVATVQLEYDVEFRGVHIYVAREDEEYVYHWWFDWATKSFWPITLTTDHEPMATTAYTPINGQQYILLGGRDGKIRHYSRDYFTDDGGTLIPSFVDIGPIKLNSDYQEGVLEELQLSLARGSGRVDWGVRVGQTADDAVYRTDTHTTGVFGERLNYIARPRSRGHSAVIRLTGKDKLPWIYEEGHATVKTAGKRRRRW